MRASFAFLVGICLVATAAPAQQAGHIGLPVDWSSRHIVSHGSAAGAQKDPRAIYNALRIQQSQALQQQAGTLPAKFQPILDWLKQSRAKAHGDWHFPLGNGTMAANAGATTGDQSPAKFSFDINAAPDCTNDYVVYALNTGGTSAQPNLVAFNNLYAGASGLQQNIVAVSETGTTVTVTTQAAHGFTAGRKVIIDGVPINGYNGTFSIATVPTTTTFTYTTTAGLAALTTGGGTATQAAAISSANESGSTVTVTTSSAHGLSVNGYVSISGVSVAGYNGVFQVASVPTTTSFTYTASTTGLAAGSGGTATGSGYCGLTPSVKFAYNISSESMTASPVISMDGTKVAFIGSSAGGATFYVLTLPTSGSSGSWDATTNQYAAVAPAALDNAALSSYKYSTTTNSFGSSPYIDYINDVAYFGDDSGKIYATNCVFYCAQNGLTLGTAWTAQFGAKPLSSPVVDLNTGKLFVGSTNGSVYMCSVANCTGTALSRAVGDGTANGGIVDGPILDNTFGTMIVTSGSSAAGGVFTIVQLDESLNQLASVANGSAAFPVPNGTISDEYYTNASGNTTSSGFGYFCGPNGGSGQAVIYTVPFSQASRTIAGTGATESGSTVTITTTTAHGFTAGQTVVIAGVAVAGYNGTFTITAVPTTTTFQYTNATTGLATSGGGTAKLPLSATNPPLLGTQTTLAIAGPNRATCSPFTVITNTSERLFFSQPTAPCPSGSAKDGCLFSYTLNTSTGTPTQAATSDQHSGTSGLIVDNISTAPQASSLYFATQSKTAPNTTSAPSCTYGTSGATGYCAVKVTQSGLQ